MHSVGVLEGLGRPHCTPRRLSAWKSKKNNTWKSKVPIAQGPCYFTCLAQTQKQCTDQGVQANPRYRSMIYTLHFLKTKAQNREFNEIQNTDQQPPGHGDLYLGFHWIPWSVPWFLRNAGYRSLICTRVFPWFLDLYFGFASRLDMWKNRARGAGGLWTSKLCA